MRNRLKFCLKRKYCLFKYEKQFTLQMQIILINECLLRFSFNKYLMK